MKLRCLSSYIKNFNYMLIFGSSCQSKWRVYFLFFLTQFRLLTILEKDIYIPEANGTENWLNKTVPIFLLSNGKCLI